MGLSAYNLNTSYAKVTAEISQSVRNIRLNSHDVFAPQNKGSVSNDNQQPSAASYFSSYAVSYLEPSASFNLQKIVSEKPEQELARQNQRKQVLDDKTDEQKLNQAPQTVGNNEFLELLMAEKPTVSNQFAAQNYLQAENQTSFSLSYASDWGLADNLKYVNDTYQYVFNINNEPKVLIDFMHKNNQTFDFRI